MDAKLISLLLFTLLIVMSTFFLWKFLPGKKPFDYGLTIDAGSSHSEVILFGWSHKINGTGHARQLASSEVSNGIDDHGEDVNATVKELYSAVRTTIDEIPEDVPGPFPVFLGATAGIRILNLTKPDLVNTILSSIKANFSKSDFDGRALNVKQVRILSGDEEGLYAWVTANYLMKTITNHNRITSGSKELSTLNENENTIGILDMGGASSQIAYQTSRDTFERGANVDSVTLFGKTYHIQSHSNLCFGSDQAYSRYLFELVRRSLANIKDSPPETDLSTKSISIPDPCNFDSPAETHKASVFTKNPCLKAPVAVELEDSLEITFTPAMNHSKCAATIIDMIDPPYCEAAYSLCPTSESGPLPTRTHFYAISSYFFSAQVLPTIQKGSDVFTNDTDYLSQVASWCNSPWTKKIELSDPRYARYLCFKQLYIYYTLRTIYQFTDDHWPYIHFRNKIGDSSLGWSLGHMLQETNVIPSKAVKPLIWPRYAFYGSIVLFVAVCLVLLSFWFGRRSKSAVINQKV